LYQLSVGNHVHQELESPQAFILQSLFKAAKAELVEYILVYQLSVGNHVHHLLESPQAFILPSLFKAAKAQSLEYI
jgi:hypothetical protein